MAGFERQAGIAVKVIGVIFACGMAWGAYGHAKYRYDQTNCYGSHVFHDYYIYSMTKFEGIDWVSAIIFPIAAILSSGAVVGDLLASLPDEPTNVGNRSCGSKVPPASPSSSGESNRGGLSSPHLTSPRLTPSVLSKNPDTSMESSGLPDQNNK